MRAIIILAQSNIVKNCSFILVHIRIYSIRSMYKTNIYVYKESGAKLCNFLCELLQGRNLKLITGGRAKYWGAVDKLEIYRRRHDLSFKM